MIASFLATATIAFCALPVLATILLYSALAPLSLPPDTQLGAPQIICRLISLAVKASAPLLLAC